MKRLQLHAALILPSYISRAMLGGLLPYVPLAIHPRPRDDLQVARAGTRPPKLRRRQFRCSVRASCDEWLAPSRGRKQYIFEALISGSQCPEASCISARARPSSAVAPKWKAWSCKPVWCNFRGMHPLKSPGTSSSAAKSATGRPADVSITLGARRRVTAHGRSELQAEQCHVNTLRSSSHLPSVPLQRCTPTLDLETFASPSKSAGEANPMVFPPPTLLDMQSTSLSSMRVAVQQSTAHCTRSTSTLARSATSKQGKFAQGSVEQRAGTGAGESSVWLLLGVEVLP